MSSLGSFFSGSGMLIIMMIVLLLVMIIPQRKRDKKIKDMLASIKVGDRVRTIGGIYGTVTNIKDDIITISVGPDKARLVFARGAIANVEDVAVENTMGSFLSEYAAQNNINQGDSLGAFDYRTVLSRAGLQRGVVQRVRIAAL